MTRSVTVSREEVDKISALSPAHRLTVEEFIKTGRWMLKDQNKDLNKGDVNDHDKNAVA